MESETSRELPSSSSFKLENSVTSKSPTQSYVHRVSSYPRQNIIPRPSSATATLRRGTIQIARDVLLHRLSRSHEGSWRIQNITAKDPQEVTPADLERVSYSNYWLHTAGFMSSL